MNTQMIHARIDASLKQQVEGVFHSLGLTSAEAIRLFYAQLICTKDYLSAVVLIGCKVNGMIA